MPILNEARATDLGLSSVKEKDELGVLRSIDFLTERGTEYINKRLEPDAKRAVTGIKYIGNAAALQRMEAGVFISLISLGRMAKAARGKEMTDTSQNILYSLCAVGKAAAGQGMEAAVRVVVAYLGEIVNSASLQNKKSEALTAALALGVVGTSVCKNSASEGSDNGGIIPVMPGILLSPPLHEDASFISDDFSEVFGFTLTHSENGGSQEGEPFLLGSEPHEVENEALDNAVIRAAHSLENIRIETDEKYMISHVLMAKISLEVFNCTEMINEAESLHK
jgi:hypothetical protein